MGEPLSQCLGSNRKFFYLRDTRTGSDNDTTYLWSKQFLQPDFRSKHGRGIVTAAFDDMELMYGMAIEVLQIAHVLLGSRPSVWALEHCRASIVHVITPAPGLAQTFVPLVALPAALVARGQAVVAGIVLTGHVHNVELGIETTGAFHAQKAVSKRIGDVASALVAKLADAVGPSVVIPLVAGVQFAGPFLGRTPQGGIGRFRAILVAGAIFLVAGTISASVAVAVGRQIRKRRWIGNNEFHVNVRVQIPKGRQGTHNGVALNHLGTYC